jgi:hypothetical protein
MADFLSSWPHCRKVAELTKDAERAELRHAERRDRAQAMEKASAELARIQPARVANSDAKALTRYLGAIGFDATPERLNDLLVLLAVVMIEVGGGLSLAAGMALSGPAREATAASPDTPVHRGRRPERRKRARQTPANAVSVGAEQHCSAVSGQMSGAPTPT